MKITFTKKAIDHIETNMEQSKLLKLAYDTEGCGCVVSGVSALWIVDKENDDEIKVDTNFIPLLIDQSKTVFFDEEMTIDFTENANCFMLKSPSQILNPRMSLLEMGE
ncbi:iron-sulfur cluster biosynthesis family protein [Cytobacillus sp. IB215665]|uniref:iron-sulfur cluster biosynthesis family protein n=1 Tax=Cytobacillus sp. IB215665 TaxID=3097357 RepID=UPI002A0DC47F|nr:iron-sulfur cluster biosynthesis family protein [Cytobacillus sp. IB215665]MDX8364362.1 iron-sulfur cluster biosynthesis family protein [Cytobacillus sp. IB215665]